MCVGISRRCRRTDLRPMYRRDEGHFPGRPFLSFFLFLRLGSAGWRRSSLISSEPTGLFFHLRIPSFPRRQQRAHFHILFLFNSLADSQPNQPVRKVPYLYLPPALCPPQLRYLTFQSVNHSAPPSSVSCVVSPQ